MELVASLILLVVLIVPPFYLAGREVLTMFFFDEADAVSGKHRRDEPEWETPPVFDGMITVEIPVSDNQVVAYDPVLEADPDDEPEIILPSSRASSA